VDNVIEAVAKSGVQLKALVWIFNIIQFTPISLSWTDIDRFELHNGMMRMFL
jgi:hypothetical protein